jgi:hypothetical protein
MKTEPLSVEVEAVIARALRESWSVHTQPSFDPKNPAYCQCAQTAIVVFEHFAGEILRTQIHTTDGEVIEHYYNRIGGIRYDFTVEQFAPLAYCKTVTYDDILSNFVEAQSTLQGTQLSAMRSAFRSGIARQMPYGNSAELTCDS